MMSDKTVKIVRSVQPQKSARCFFCNTFLPNPSTRNCRDMFKTRVNPLQRKASDLISDLLDVEVIENRTHSRFTCLKCFNMVAEFAELDARAGELRTDMITNYHTTKRTVEGSPQPVIEHLIEEDEEASAEDEKTTIKLDAEKLNKLVEEASGGSLKLKPGPGGEPPKLLVVNDGEYKEISLAHFLRGEVEEEEEEEAGEEETVEEEEDQEEEDDDDEDYEDEDEKSAEITKFVDDMHVCLLCSSNNPYSCEQSQMNLMRYHVLQEHKLKYYFCDICADAFAKKASLVRHVEKHHSGDLTDMTCEQCNRSFTSLKLFRIHKRQHAGTTKAWSCEVCGKRYSSRNLLEEHMNSHLGVKPYNCDTCGKSFSSKYTYKAHLKIHSSRDRNYPCPKCNKGFMSQQNLMQHLKTHSETKDHVCDTCGKGFGSLRNLEVHSVVHSGLKPYVCSFCNKAFARKAEIKDHERTHTGEKPFVCEHCGSQFSQRSNLQSHKRVTHFNDRRYTCESCGKGFKRKRLLDYHVKAVHTGERPFSCETCDATFVYPEHYKKHIRIHTGIKPFKCEVCDKAFNSRDNRNAHRFVHSDKKPYECLVCGVGFMRKPLLYSHMQQAGHLNDTIVVNQPRLEKTDDEQSADQELLIVDESNFKKIINQKVYLTDAKGQIIEGDEKTLFAKLDDGNIKTMTTSEGSKQLLDSDGNFIDLDDNMISIEELEDNSTMMAHFNERGELVNEHGEIITEEGQTLIVDDSMGDDEDGQIQIKTESNDVRFVQIEVPDGENSSRWLKMVKSEKNEQ